MITYRIGIEVTCQGISKIFVGYRTGDNPEQAQTKALDHLQSLEEFQDDKELRTFEVIQCIEYHDYVPLDEFELYQL
ncbi:MAG TPA: hypothetical protein VK050_08535 [Flavobacteriaceae bacterium]|nr:hypothetical protein [Flavobacteriaceae bacterium]